MTGESPRLAIGTDIVDIQRIQCAILKFGNKFLKKVFTQNELQYCFNTSKKYHSLAVRFSAKEAFSKALGIGIGAGSLLKWHDISVENSRSGKPIIILSDGASQLMRENDFNSAKVSLSHTKTLAQAVVILIS